MTIKQYQKLAATVASKIEDLGGDVDRTRNLYFANGVTISARDPKKYAELPVSFESGESNSTIEFDTISNPNNPNAKFRTLKAGAMSAYNSQTGKNLDLTAFNFDTAQFRQLIELIKQDGWTIIR